MAGTLRCDGIWAGIAHQLIDPAADSLTPPKRVIKPLIA